MDQPYYPINDFGPLMKGLVIGGLGIVHVFVAQFAIGAGLLMCYFQWLAQTGRCLHARPFLTGYFRFFVLVSFVIGALTGVGMWFTSIQISPGTIGLMVGEFHWVWATEWTFFCVEIVTGYAFYRYADRLTEGERLTLLCLYSTAAWMSLFWINGILSWQLTPGKWTATRWVWDGFFNPTFWPSLLYRTVVAMTLAGLTACVVINALTELPRAARGELMGRAAQFLVFMVFMPPLGVWYLGVMPEDSRSWVLGGSAAMTLFTMLSVGSSLLIGLYAIVGLVGKRLYINGATATLLCALAFAATAGGEFIREGSRKPYSIRETLYSNSITPAAVASLRQQGSNLRDPYALRGAEAYPHEQLRLGARVFRFQCAVCHTIDGINGLMQLAGSWTTEQKRMNLANLQNTKPFMPPFAGSVEELEALVQMIEWEKRDRPPMWTSSSTPDALARVRVWLEEAGTAPAHARRIEGS